MDSSFLDAFWPDLFATLIGVGAGVPIALWLLNRPTRSERERFARALEVVRDTLEANRNLLGTLGSTVRSENQAPTRLPLSIAAWEATRAEIVAHLDDPDLYLRLARHFERLRYLIAQHDRYLEIVVGPAAALTGSDQIRKVIAGTIGVWADELLREIDVLTNDVAQRIQERG